MLHTNKHTPSSAIQIRIARSQVDIMTFKGIAKDALFQHSILCQTFLPYRNPGNSILNWEHHQGKAQLSIQSNKVWHPETKSHSHIGLPYGVKARLLFLYLNTLAVQNQSPLIPIEGKLSTFMKQMGMDTNGRNIADTRKIYRRLMLSTISLSYHNKEGNIKIVRAFDIPPDRQHAQLDWLPFIHLSDTYYNSLIQHAIPIDKRAIRALAHNAMAIDLYTWLSQRLHRVPKLRPQFISWAAVRAQFGPQYKRMCDFKSNFRKYLTVVLTQYPSARIKEIPNKGFSIQYSPSPIRKKDDSIAHMIRK